MVRLFWVTLTTLFIFCGCQSAPTFGQSATAAPPVKGDGLIDSMVQGVSSLLGGTAAGSTVAPPTLTDVAIAVTGLETKVAGVQTKLDSLQGRVDDTLARVGQADRHARLASLVGWALLALNGLVVLLVLLVLTGIIGRPPVFSDQERAKILELRAIRKRQAKLAAAIEELQTYVVQSTEDREHFTSLVKAAAQEFKKLESAAAES